MDLKYDTEYVMVTDSKEHWELRKERSIKLKNRPEIMSGPGESFYTKDMLNGLSLDDIRKNVRQKPIGTFFIKVDKDREIENMWEGAVSNLRIEQDDIIRFRVIIITPIKNDQIPQKYIRYTRENGWYKINDEQKAIDDFFR